MTEPTREDRPNVPHEFVAHSTSVRHKAMSFPLTVVLAVVGAVLPGVGLLVAGRRRSGLAVLAGFGLLVAGAAYLGTTGQRMVLHWWVQPQALLVIGLVLPVLAAIWCLVVIATYRTIPRHTHSVPQRLVGTGVVVVLVLTIAAPLALVSRYALVQKSLIEQVFAAPEPPTSMVTPAGRHENSVQTHEPTTRKANPVADPWEGRDRVNVLLLGGDGGADRQGVRPDTIILASIDTHTGSTVLFSVPRNLQRIPFPPGSPLAKVYPQGIYAGKGDQLEWMINTIYRNVPMQHPGLLHAVDPGAVATKIAVTGVLGLDVDYYVLVNLKGFEKLVDALGGITVNVNQRVAVGGEATAGLKPHHWIEKGPNQHFDGFDALWFARGRYGASDWDRMIRQRCVIKAIIDQANPITLLTRYEALAQTSKDILHTDIPASKLPAFIDLSFKVKDANVTSIAFLNTVIKPANPDYARMRTLVQNALAASRGTLTSTQHLDSLDTACAYSPES